MVLVILFLFLDVVVTLVILYAVAVAARAAAPHEPVRRPVTHPNVPGPGPLENRQFGVRIESFALCAQVAVALLSGLDEELLLV